MALPIITDRSQQWPQYLAVFSVCLSTLSSGMTFGWPSPAIPQMLSHDYFMSVTSEDISLIAVTGPLGYLVGGPLSAYIVNVIGRKRSLQLVAAPQTIAWLMIGFSESVAAFCVARFIAGIGEVAMFSLVSMYIGEISEPKVRGRLGAFLTISFVTGMLLINVMGSHLTISETAFACTSVPILFLATFSWMPESPYYHIMRNDPDASRRCLQRLRRLENVDEELAQLTHDVNRQMSESGTYRDLFRIASNRKALFILFGLRTTQQMTGVSAFGMYYQKLFADAGGDVSASTSAIIMCSTQILIIIVGSAIVDRAGRRPLLCVSCLGTSLSLLLTGTYFYLKENHEDLLSESLNWIPLVAMVTFMVLFSIGLGTVVNLMMGELFSASIKAKALCLNNISFGLYISATTKLYQVLVDYFGLYAPFYIYGVCSAAGFVFCFFCVPETKGKTLEEIQQRLKGTKKIEPFKEIQLPNDSRY